MKLFLFLVAICGTLSALAKPANDWSKPCFHGECAYDVPESTGHSGALKLYGSPRSITDITPAAGWVILDCDAHALEQEIRLVCTSDDAEAAGCNHVFDHGGPVNKLVRLPESCSAGPFLRIASARLAEDQSIPDHAVGKISRRDGSAPKVHILKVDGNWAAVDVSQTGTVNFVYAGANVPGVDGDALGGALLARDADGLFDWVSNAWNSVKNAVVTAANAVATGFNTAVQAVKNLTGFKINPEHVMNIHHQTDGPVVVYETPPAERPNCGNGVSAHIKVTANGLIKADVKLGILANGSVIPPSIGTFAAYAIINADVDAHLTVDATIIGHIETEKKRLFDFPITPLQIPAIFQLGPSIQLHAKAELDLALEVNIDAGLKYHVEQLEFWYPKKVTEADPKDAKDGEKVIRSDPAPISIAATANVHAEASITGHLIPSLNLGFELLGGTVAQLNAYVEVDAWARAHLTGDATGAVRHRALDAPEAEYGVSRRDYVPPYLNTREVAARGVTASFKGCFDLSAGVAVRAGAMGGIFGLKAETNPWVIFETKTPLKIYHNCWGGAIGKRSLSSLEASLERRRSPLTCGHGAPVTVGSGTSESKKLD